MLYTKVPGAVMARSTECTLDIISEMSGNWFAVNVPGFGGWVYVPAPKIVMANDGRMKMFWPAHLNQFDCPRRFRRTYFAMTAVLKNLGACVSPTCSSGRLACQHWICQGTLQRSPLMARTSRMLRLTSWPRNCRRSLSMAQRALVRMRQCLWPLPSRARWMSERAQTRALTPSNKNSFY